MKTTMKTVLAGVLALGALVGDAEQQRRRNITASEASLALGEVAVFQDFPENTRLGKLGSVEAEGSHFHLFTCWLNGTRRWRTLVLDNNGSYLGYYETLDEPVELERSGIVYPGDSYSAATGDEEEGVFDSGDAHIVNFSKQGPPDEVKFETRTYRFVSSPKRVRPDEPAYRFIAVAERMAAALNRGRYQRIRDDFGAQALAAISEDQTRTAFQSLRTRLGKIDRIGQPWIQAADTAVFPASFDRETIGLKLKLDSDGGIAGLSILPYKMAFPDIGPHATPLALPFEGRWLVLWGGATRETSKYFGSRSRDHALEFVVADQNGNTFLAEGRRNEDYYAFGRPVLAPAAGTVAAVAAHHPDNRPRSPDPYRVYGNMVAIQHSTNEVSIIGHLMQDSILVKPGDVVAAGQLIGRCGNSGDSTQPGIYYHLQDSPQVPNGTGYTTRFAEVLLWERGRAERRRNHAPVRGQFVEQPAAAAKTAEPSP